MENGRRIAVAQTTPVRGNVGANIDQHLLLARLAARQGARVVLFPELSLTGYELDLAADLGMREDSPVFGPLAEFAANHSVILIVGAPIRRESVLYLGALILYPDGRRELYTKQHLAAFREQDAPDGVVPPPEASVFEPGQHAPLVDFDGNVGALSVCYESMVASHPEAAAGQGARTYFSSQFGIPDHIAFKIAVLQKHAKRFGLLVPLANFGGATGGLPAGGGSGFWSEQGELLTQLPSAGAGVAVALEEAQGFRTWQTMIATGA